MPVPLQSRAARYGFATIEVLVSILILSIGIIGLIRLQVGTTHITQHNGFYGHALLLATEMVNKMAGNQEQLRAGNNLYVKVDFRAAMQTPQTAASCAEMDCNPDQLASADITEWLKKISDALPNAHAKICLDDAPWDESRQSLRWDCQSSTNHPTIFIKLGWTEKENDTDNPAPLIAIPAPAQIP